MSGLQRARGAVVGVLLSALLVALTGCTGGAPTPVRPTASVVSPSHPTSTPTPTPNATALLDPLIRSEGHISATGATGALVIGASPADDGVRVTVEGFRPAGSAAQRLLLTTVATGSDCARALTVDVGGLSSTETQTFSRPYPWENTYEDLSMLRFAVLMPVHLTWQEACSRDEDTVVPLTWSVPAALAQLAVVDHGTRYGAHGRVVERAGKPLRYVVTDRDLLDDVATRFGLTPDELLWLTPSRSHGQDGLLYAGEQLNLDPAFRGLFT